jgi:hypothetical protein
MLLNRPTAKIILVIVANIAIIFSLLTIEYTMRTDVRRKPIILSESTEIIDNGKMVSIILFDTFEIVPKYDKQYKVIVSASISL